MRRAAAAAVPPSSRSSARMVHPAEVMRVIDGDTFEARVHLWPGLDVTTRVRLRGIDAPELKARCGEERVKAEAARDALRTMLDQGEVGISRVTLDKYGGRVVADASTRATPDVSPALLERRRGPPLLRRPPRRLVPVEPGDVWLSARHDHRRADADAIEQIGDVLVVHADAAIGDEAADRARIVGAVDGVVAAGQRQRRDAHRIVRRAAGDDLRHVAGVLALDVGRRRPRRADVLAVDDGAARPTAVRRGRRRPDRPSRGPGRARDRAGARWCARRSCRARRRR